MAATSARQWKKTQTGDLELKLPSGNTCLVRRLRPEAFLESGMIPDMLSDMVTKAIKTKKGLPPQAVEAMTKDPAALKKGLQMMDEVLCYVVMEPDVQMPPKCGVILPSSEKPCNAYMDTDDDRHTDPSCADHHVYMEDARDEDTLYADEVDLNDKSFIFQFVLGGTADLERFRQELQADVEPVSDGEAVPRKAKRTTKRR